LAATGTGKTAAFALPLLQLIQTGGGVPAALILVPTRELAIQVAQAVHRYGKLLGVEVLRPLPSLTMVANAVQLDELLGLPIQLRWTGVTVDAALRVAEPLAHDGNAALARDWMRLAALHGSTLEHRLFERDFSVDSISADKGLALARQAGVEVNEPDRAAFVEASRAVYEEFGRAVLEALAIGLPAVLPPVFRETFGDAALYAEPIEVWGRIAALWADEAAYLAQARRGREFVMANSDWLQFPDRLAQTIAEAGAPLGLEMREQPGSAGAPASFS